MYTYATLLAALQSITSDDDADFVAEIPKIIGRAESRLARDLDLELFEQINDAIAATIGSRSLAKPTGTVMVSSLWYRDAVGAHQTVEERGYDYCVEYAPNESTDTGAPKYYAELESNLYLSPTPAAAHAFRMKTITRPTGLTAVLANSWLGTHMGDVLLQAALLESWQFLKDNAKMNEAATVYASLLPTAKAEVGKLARRTYAGLGMAPVPNERGER